MNNRFVVKTSVLKKIDQKKHYSKYAIPTKPGPCFLQYHIAMSNLFLQQAVTFKEVIIRDPVSHSPMVHSEVISRLLIPCIPGGAGLNADNKHKDDINTPLRSDP